MPNGTMFTSAKDAFSAKRNHLIIPQSSNFRLSEEIENATKFIVLAQSELASIVLPSTSFPHSCDTNQETEANISFPCNVEVEDILINSNLTPTSTDENYQLHSLDLGIPSKHDLQERVKSLSKDHYYNKTLLWHLL